MPEDREDQLGEPRKDPSSDPDWRNDPFWDPQWKPEDPPPGGFWEGLVFAALWLIGALGGAVGLLLTILLALIWIGSTALVLTALFSPGRGLVDFEALAAVTALSWLLLYWRLRKAFRRDARDT